MSLLFLVLRFNASSLLSDPSIFCLIDLLFDLLMLATPLSPSGAWDGRGVVQGATPSTRWEARGARKRGEVGRTDRAFTPNE